MLDKHKEKNFEEEIVAYLVSQGWLEGDASEYDRELALYPSDLIGWIQDTQSKEWAKVVSWHEANAGQALCERAAKLMDEQGSLSLLRHGFKDKNARFQLCQFKPSHGFNPEIADRHAKVRCRIVRQVRYSTGNENSIDLVLFINGIRWRPSNSRPISPSPFTMPSANTALTACPRMPRPRRPSRY